MKVRLTGIQEDEMPDTRALRTLELPAQRTKGVIARLEGCGGDWYLFTHISVPVEMIGDAKIGDEFTLHLERVRK